MAGALVITLAVAAFGVGPATAAETPEQVVSKTGQQVIDILAKKDLSSDQKKAQIEQVADSCIDFSTLSKLVLGRNWSKLSATQQQEFTQEFRKHLSVTYGRNVDNYKNERLTILGGRDEARGDYTVLSKIARGGPDDILVDYRLRQTDGNWLIIDIIVEGVSLVSNFRSQFQDILANGGPQRLIELLREKNARGEPLKS